MLGVLTALEAVVIVALLLREPLIEPAQAPSFGETSDGSDRAPIPAPRTGELPKPDIAAHPAAVSTSTASPQLLEAPSSLDEGLGLMIVGTVRAADDQAIDDSLVWLKLSDRDDSFGISHGAYAIAGLEPGVIAVECEAVGYTSQVANLALDASRPIERHDFRLEAASIVPVALRTPEGQPLLREFEDARIPGRLWPLVSPEALVVGSPAPPTLDVDWIVFEQQPDPAEGDDAELVAQGWTGKLSVGRAPPFHVSLAWSSHVLDSRRVEDSAAGVVFTVPLSRFLDELCGVRARIIDAADRRPVAGFLAQLDNEQPVDVGEDGVLQLERVTPGGHLIYFYPPGAWQRIDGGSMVLRAPGSGDYERPSFPIKCLAGQVLDLGELAVRRTVIVRGRVTNGSGVPVVSTVQATLVDYGVGPGSVKTVLNAVVDVQDGSFTLHVVPGRWSFSAGPDSSASPRLVDVTDDVDDLRLIGVGAPVGN